MSVMPARSSTPCWRRVSIALRMFCSETPADRKSTRLNSSHLGTSYDVFCLKKKNLEGDLRTRIARADQEHAARPQLLWIAVLARMQLNDIRQQLPRKHQKATTRIN